MGDSYSSSEATIDADVTDALVKMGLDGSWKGKNDLKEKENEDRSSGKKNIFDEL